MYTSIRMMRAQSGKAQELAAQAAAITNLINERLGTDLMVTVQIGGNPDLVQVSAPWQSLDAYQAAREAMAADDEITSMMQTAAGLGVEANDILAQVVKPPAERAAFGTITTANMHMTKITEAIPMALEICEFAEAKVGSEIGLLTAVTGNRSLVAWVGYADSLASLDADRQILESDPEYLDFFKRAADIFVDGSLESVFAQRVS